MARKRRAEAAERAIRIHRRAAPDQRDHPGVRRARTSSPRPAVGCRGQVSRVARPQTGGAGALTGPGAGGEAKARGTRAERRGDGWVLNGPKVLVTQGSRAGVYVILAQTDPEGGHRSISAFIVERGTPGLRVGKHEDKLGVRSSDTAEIVLEDCAVPEEQMLGAPGEGYRNALHVLERARIGIGAMALGLGRAALEASLGYARERRAFGQPIAEFQAIQWMLA